MSRRSRKRSGAKGKTGAGKLAVALLVVMGVVLIGAYIAVRGYLHSEKFRVFLSAEASKAAGIEGQFSPFQWEGLAVNTARFGGEGEGMIKSITADGLHTEIGLGGISRGVWEIQGTRVRNLEVSLDASEGVDRDAAAAAEKKAKKATSRAGWLPKDAELKELEISSLSLAAMLKQGALSAQGVKVTAKQSGARNSFKMAIEGGSVQLPYRMVPDLQVDKILGRYKDGTFFLTQARLGAWKGGTIDASGEMDFRTRVYTVEGGATGVNGEDLLGPTWAKRLTGQLDSNFRVSNPTGEPQASGEITLSNGTLTALPVLDVLSAYADTRRFRVINLTEARSNWRWEKDKTTLEKFVLSSDGLIRIEGDITMTGRDLSGLIRLGLAPGTLATIPGAETDVFLPGEKGLVWTTVRIGGTLDDPKEDLTDRLIAAAGIRILNAIPETGDTVIKAATTLLNENPDKALEHGTKIIREGNRVIRDVEGILGGFLREEKPKEKEKEEQ